MTSPGPDGLGEAGRHLEGRVEAVGEARLAEQAPRQGGVVSVVREALVVAAVAEGRVARRDLGA